ncbi:hypothetical protein VPNG_09126 [Cytospora leucostoma]|uniref:Uncharacterized protein n=1 Tax=Cytospora leucostoma TaxID=1230097 RepID=A0A423VYG0_9PEZI|nr:hypothetical protein VPNG_09126 [Cytospora leucostoma]
MATFMRARDAEERPKLDVDDPKKGGVTALLEAILVSTALKTDAQAGEVPVVLMAYGFGCSDGVEHGTRLTLKRTQANLALTYEGINGPKCFWSGQKQPTITAVAVVQERIRNGAGVFQYLAYTPTTGNQHAVWNKWMSWSRFKSSMGSLYAKFIDEESAGIEALVAT